jgi:hypothetical protein
MYTETCVEPDNQCVLTTGCATDQDACIGSDGNFAICDTDLDVCSGCTTTTVDGVLNSNCSTVTANTYCYTDDEAKGSYCTVADCVATPCDVW